MNAQGQSELLLHTVLVGLTPLIPVPLLDDAVKAAVERRMVRRIAARHGRELSKREVKHLTEDASGSLLWSIGKGLVTFPFKLIFRKLFVVLEVKRASDEASRAYHRGYLLDRVLAADLLAPDGRVEPAQLRAALDATLADVSTSPIGLGLGGVFEGSRGLLARVGQALWSRLGKAKVLDREKVEHAVEGAIDEETGGALDALIARMREAIAAVPDAHFDQLAERLGKELGVSLP